MPTPGKSKGSAANSVQTTLMDFVQPKVPESESNGNQQFQVVKKRKASDSPEQIKSTSKFTPITVKNRFAPLLTSGKTNGNASPLSNQAQTNQSKQPVKDVLPPPIFIKDVTNFTELVRCISTHVNPGNFTTKALANSSVKVSITNVAEYRKLITYLRESKTCFYTYQLKTEKPFKIVIRNLHHSLTPDEIKEALSAQGHEVRNIVNIRHWKTKIPLSMFFVDLEPKSNNQEIYQLKTLLHMRIVVESPKPKRSEVQCKRCQHLGHTHAYCTLPPACVRCGGDHDNRSCPKPADAKPECANCHGEHPANYRGCPEFAKRPQLQIRRPRPSPASQDSQPPAPTKLPSLSRGTIAEVAAAKSESPVPASSSSRLETLLEKMLRQQDEARQQTAKLIDLITTLISRLVK